MEGRLLIPANVLLFDARRANSCLPLAGLGPARLRRRPCKTQDFRMGVLLPCRSRNLIVCDARHETGADAQITPN